MDMGHVPSAADDGGSACTTGPDCHTFLIGHTVAGQPLPATATIPIDVGGLQFTVQLETDPWASRYVVDLDRVWFWDAAPAGAARSIDFKGATGANFELVRKKQSPNALY